MYIENIVIGAPIVPAMTLLGTDIHDMLMEEAKTYFTANRCLAQILKEIEVVKSVSEVRRNKPEFCEPIKDDVLDCRWVKWGKRKFYVIIGQPIQS